MNIFRSKPPRMKFEVVMKIEELTNIPVVNATTVVRWKVKGGGSASGVTERAHVSKNMVTWSQPFVFDTSIRADSNGILRPRPVHFHARMDSNNNKGDQPLGYVIADLSTFAGAKSVTRLYLLQNSQLNSTLKITVSMRQLSGDPYYKVPSIEPQLPAAFTATESADIAVTMLEDEVCTTDQQRARPMPNAAPRPPRLARFPTAPLPDCDELTPDMIVDQLFEELNL